jgi:hypothetical protein
METNNSNEEQKPQSDYDRFVNGMRRLLQVSKEELDEQLKKDSNQIPEPSDEDLEKEEGSS